MANYGTDVAWYPDLDANLRLVSGNYLLAQAIWQRLSTPRGTFPWDTEYGLDVRGLLNATIGPNTIPSWQRQIANECEKDERVLSVTVTITLFANDTMQIGIDGIGSAGPFTATLGVTRVTTALLEAA